MCVCTYHDKIDELMIASKPTRQIRDGTLSRMLPFPKIDKQPRKPLTSATYHYHSLAAIYGLKASAIIEASATSGARRQHLVTTVPQRLRDA